MTNILLEVNDYYQFVGIVFSNLIYVPIYFVVTVKCAMPFSEIVKDFSKLKYKTIWKYSDKMNLILSF